MAIECIPSHSCLEPCVPAGRFMAQVMPPSVEPYNPGGYVTSCERAFATYKVEVLFGSTAIALINVPPNGVAPRLVQVAPASVEPYSPTAKSGGLPFIPVPT